jgi:hypothetical protein
MRAILIWNYRYYWLAKFLAPQASKEASHYASYGSSDTPTQFYGQFLINQNMLELIE